MGKKGICYLKVVNKMGRQKRVNKNLQSHQSHVESSINDPKEVVYNHPSPTGFKNLGQTCFYNSVMQCLCQTNLLWSVLKDEKDNEGKMRNILPYGGDVELSEDEILKIEVPRMSKMLTTTLDLLDKVYNQDSSSAKMTRTRTQRKNTAINPGELFNEICAKSKRFNSYEQDDSMALFDTLVNLTAEEDKKVSFNQYI